MDTLFLNKLIALIISPLGMIIGLAILGVIKRSFLLVISGLVLLIVLSTSVISSSIWRSLELEFPYRPIDQLTHADATIVLSGMLSFSESPYGLVTEWGDPDRFFSGIDILKGGKSDFIVFTRGKVSWNELPAEGDLLKVKAIDLGVDETHILLTSNVANTAEEAAAVKSLLDSAGLSSIILVTSSYHMPRAIRIFRSTGLQVQAYPVDFAPNQSSLTLLDFIPRADAFHRTSAALREWLGRFYYFVMLHD